MHFDFSFANLNTGSSLDGDSISYSLGTHANYFVNPNWYVRGQLTGSLDVNDMKYHLPNTHANDDYSSYFLYTALTTGYIWQINAQNSIVPEIGLSYLYATSDDIDFNFAGGYAGYNMSIDALSYHALYATAAISWQGDFVLKQSAGEAGNIRFKPSAGLGIRQNITGNDIDSKLYFVGQNFETQTSEDSTSILANAGLEWTKGKSTFAVLYNGAYGEDQMYHTGKLMLKYEF